jgi:hypothetical protein
LRQNPARNRGVRPILPFGDLPEKKEDFVQGDYLLDAPAKPTAIAVKITNMLGEEVLVTEHP